MHILACLPHLFVLFKIIKEDKLNINKMMDILIRAILSFFLIILVSQTFSFFYEKLPFYYNLATGIFIEEGIKCIGFTVRKKTLNKKELYLFAICLSILETSIQCLTIKTALLNACLYYIHASFSMIFLFFMSAFSSKKAGILLGIFFATTVHFIYDLLTYKMNLIIFLLLVFLLRLSLMYFLNTLPNEADCAF